MTDRVAPLIAERDWEGTALSELVVCDSVAQVCSWIARWSARVAGADAALVWIPHSVNPTFFCAGGWGEGTEGALRRSASRDEGVVHQLIRDRRPVAFDQPRSSSDPLVTALPEYAGQCIAVPLERDRTVRGVLALAFRERADPAETVARLEKFLNNAVAALARAARAESKNLGMVRAIERLTSLYDLSKAFTSTIDLPELSEIVVQKAVDLANAEVASLWTFEPQAGEVVLAATAVNERFSLPEPPTAVGTSVVGNVLADRAAVIDNEGGLQEGDYAIGSLIALPLMEEDVAVGALVITNKRGRHPEFTPTDEDLLIDLARQAVRALHNAKLYEAERRVEELDALLAVSREITSTLDLDRVLKTIVNASSALIEYERSAIALLQHGRLRLGAVSGVLEVDRRNPDVRRLDELLQWVFFSGSEIAVTCDEEGEVDSDRPETAEKFRVYFQETGMRSFYAALLQDEEGKLGVLSFESKEPLLFDEDTRDLLQILKNQATVAVRNAQLYQQVPLVGMLKPFIDRKTKIEALPRSRFWTWVIGGAIALLLLVVVPWPLRVEGPARVLPGRRVAVTASVDGVIQAVDHREGDAVRAGDVIARLRDDGYRAALAEARSALQIAESDLARYRLAGNAAETFQAQARCDELRARIGLAGDQLARTQIRAPADGIVLTPNLEERVGQYLASGSELAVIGDVRRADIEVAVPEAETALLKPGEAVALKLNPYPTRTYHGEVARVGASIHEEGKERFVIAECTVANPDGSLRSGMLGRGKVQAGVRPVIVVLLRKPLRYLWLRFWPFLP